MRGENILLVANYGPDVGYAWWLMERFWKEIAAVGRERGVDVFVAYPKEGPVNPDLLEAGIQPLFYRIRSGAPVGLTGVLRMLRRHRIRSMYLTDRAYFDPLYVAYRAAGVRTIINHDHTPGDRPNVYGLRGWLKSIRNRVPGMHADQWIALSPLMRQRAIGNARIPADRVSVVPNGIVPITPDPDARARVLETFGLPADAQLVVTVGRAHPYKRIEFVMQVAERIRSMKPGVELVFVYLGSGPHLEALQAHAAELGLAPPYFTFGGHRDDVRSLLPGFDHAMHAAKGEGFSLAILEYMSAGLATLVTEVPSVSQAIDHGRTGFVYRDGDVDDAATLLHRLACSRELRDGIGEAAARKVADSYALEDSAARFRSVVAPMLWSRGAP